MGRIQTKGEGLKMRLAGGQGRVRPGLRSQGRKVLGRRTAGAKGWS